MRIRRKDSQAKPTALIRSYPLRQQLRRRECHALARKAIPRFSIVPVWHQTQGQTYRDTRVSACTAPGRLVRFRIAHDRHHRSDLALSRNIFYRRHILLQMIRSAMCLHGGFVFIDLVDENLTRIARGLRKIKLKVSRLLTRRRAIFFERFYEFFEVSRSDFIIDQLNVPLRRLSDSILSRHREAFDLINYESRTALP